MKLLKWLLILIILTVGISACSPAETGTADSQATQEPLTQDENEELAYPYPKPTLKPSPTAIPYPDEAEQSEAPELISWEDAVQLIKDGQVVEVTQYHSLEVLLTLDDGSQFTTTEPEIDIVLEAIDECGDACSEIVVITE